MGSLLVSLDEDAVPTEDQLTALARKGYLHVARDANGDWVALPVEGSWKKMLEDLK